VPPSSSSTINRSRSRRSARCRRDELVFNIVSTAKASVNYGLPIIHSTVNIATGRNKPPIRELQDVLGYLPTYDRTSINSW
jgi:hypothetical protein